MWWLQVRTPEAMISKNVQEMLVESGLINNLVQLRSMPQHEFFEACMYGLSKSDAA